MDFSGMKGLCPYNPQTAGPSTLLATKLALPNQRSCSGPNCLPMFVCAGHMARKQEVGMDRLACWLEQTHYYVIIKKKYSLSF